MDWTLVRREGRRRGEMGVASDCERSRRVAGVEVDTEPLAALENDVDGVVFSVTFDAASRTSAAAGPLASSASDDIESLNSGYGAIVGFCSVSVSSDGWMADRDDDEL